MIVLLDTNFMAACIEHRVDVVKQLEHHFESVSFLVVKRVLEEAEFLPLRQQKRIQAFLKGVPHEVIDAQGHTDDVLLKEAEKRKAAVATLDLGLKKRLKRRCIPIISLAHSRVVIS